MYLKRIHERAAAGEPVLDGKGKPKLDHIEIHHTGVKAAQHFSTGLVEAAIAEGWMSIGKGKLVLHGKPEDLVYTILRGPGRYCCHCGEKLDDDATGIAARAHVAEKHAGAASPDPANPAGYAKLEHYECELAPELHEQYRYKGKLIAGIPPEHIRALRERRGQQKKGASHG